MKHTLVSLFLCVPFLFLSSCKETELPPFDANRAFAEVEALVEISPRDAGTPAGKKAAEHLCARLTSFGIKAQVESFQVQTPAGKKSMHNVIGYIKGTTKQWIVLGSHFDTMPGIPNFQGANDSGSSTGVLLELARLCAKYPPKVGIIFAFFDGEESSVDYRQNDGLYGSRHFAQQIKQSGLSRQVYAMVLLDMVGDKSLHFTIPMNSSTALIREFVDATDATGYHDRFSLLPISVIDDHVSFREIGIPSIDIIDFYFGSKPKSNDYWHTPADDLKHISVESLNVTGTIALQLVRQLAY